MKKSFLFRFSECNYCQKKLAFYHIIPIFSFLFFRGKSRCCERPIPIIYFLMELVTPIYILLLYIQFSFSYSFLLYYIIYYFLAFFFITDIFYLYVPNSILIVFFCVLATIAILYNQTLMDLIYSGGISCLFYLLFFIIFRKGIGLGDIKILIILSTFLGFKIGYYIFFLAIIMGTIILLTALMLKKVKKNKQVPFVPYIFVSFLLISILMK
ncbi:late competence protein C [Listeria monocytogenes serotype 1/2a str. 10-5024]|nr:late competence protein C [Listeria monocytogenes serotype 1/2a str. 08-6569]AHF35352.1 late competence protein C [Listeria monocytogenes serotype 1/2a str. 08-6997]AHF38343.1 late competence protein C [Listeria monocytogenes serotype 1/2a str. 10-0815]AHF44225.1 late competence protein C [Listeria monocytogenes serotype 1/2a str. 88-0478]AHI70285.1 late competence protein C [Listeria monocytogenes serotype 1/2a str. 01-1280]ASG97142.1 late competence protein C [Listeria monocytogenes serot